LTEAQRAAGVEFLKRWPTVDIHSHPGRFFMEGAQSTPFAASFPPPFTETAVRDIGASGVSAVMFAAVSDHLLLELSDEGLQAFREFAPGEAYQDYQRQIRQLKAIVAQGQILGATDSQAVVEGHRHGHATCLFSVEGGDFIEDRLERLAEAYDDGVRAITIIHYNINQIGDTQTEPPRHGGLTALGKSIVAEMNRQGILVDLSHASFEASQQAAEISNRPMLFSHTNLRKPRSTHPRLISLDQARLVTETGGLLGATPAGFGQSTFRQFISTILRMVDAVGVDHVAIGTDLDFTYKPVFTHYRDWSLIPAELLARGMREDEVAKVMGGNFLRLLDTATTGRAAGAAGSI